MAMNIPAKLKAMLKSRFADVTSDVEITMTIIGGKYKSEILWWLSEKKVLRYSEIQRLIPTATAKMLSQQLKELETFGMVNRKLYPVVPPKTEYSLTELGESVLPVVNMLCDWGGDFLHALNLPSVCDKKMNPKRTQQ